ncbi:MAG: hypothetical protein LUC90_04760 [Lachnospiraceae bacterium]|nr:hypothetical protein [Lachnospiraceae bacterium]
MRLKRKSISLLLACCLVTGLLSMTELRVQAEEPVKVEISAETEESAGTGELTGTEEPGEAEESAEAEETGEVEESSGAEETGEAQDPSGAEETGEKQGPAGEEEAAGTEELNKAGESVEVTEIIETGEAFPLLLTGVSAENEHTHDYDADTGICSCGSYQPAEQDENGVYQIGNAGQLYWFAALVNGDTSQEGITEANASANAVLTANIDLNPYVTTLGEEGTLTWTPIGNYGASTSLYYTGTFDGKGYTISGLYIDTTADSYQGLFGEASGATISNITLAEDCYISGVQYVGGIAGACGVRASGASITSCVNKGTVNSIGKSRTSYVGGIVGNMGNSRYSGVITSCTNEGTVTGSNGCCGHSRKRQP